MRYCEKILRYWNRVSAQVSVKWPLTPLRKMIYEAASPPEYCPASPILISISTHYVVVICPNLHFKSCRTPSVCISDSHLRFLAAVKNCPPPPPTPPHRPRHTSSGVPPQFSMGTTAVWWKTGVIFMCKCQSVRSQQSQARLLQRSGLETQPE